VEERKGVRQNAGSMDAQRTPARRGRPPRGAAGLSRDRIVAATLAVIADDGLGAVGVRAVARRLGVDPKSLYNHVDGKDGLLDAVAEHLLRSIALPEPTGDLRADLRAAADAFRRTALAHPEASVLVLTRQLSSLEALAPVQLVLGTLRAAGCATDEAVHVLRTLIATLVGMLLREVEAGPTFGTADPAGIAERERTLRASGLPAVAAAAPQLARFDAEAEFDYAVELAIDAIVVRLGRARR
jgi:TetR/AcrR family transcriptional regulator, tetracycline repressor protein